MLIIAASLVEVTSSNTAVSLYLLIIFIRPSLVVNHFSALVFLCNNVAENLERYEQLQTAMI